MTKNLRVQILSDLHLDQYKDRGELFINKLNPETVDVLILAGDITSGHDITDCVARFSARFSDAQILWVNGNHEYYGTTKEVVWGILQDAQNQFENFRWLNNEIATIQGQRFLGSTLWYAETPEAILKAHRWSDFKAIRQLRAWVWEEARKAKQFLETECQPGDVVITHMLPARQSIDPVWKDSWTNLYFYHDCEQLIFEKAPRYWIHGHTHSTCRYDFHGCEVVCNPKGNLYKNYDRRLEKFVQSNENKDFIEKYFLDIQV